MTEDELTEKQEIVKALQIADDIFHGTPDAEAARIQLNVVMATLNYRISAVEAARSRMERRISLKLPSPCPSPQTLDTKHGDS
jgi:hypothetical protein